MAKVIEPLLADSPVECGAMLIGAYPDRGDMVERVDLVSDLAPPVLEAQCRPHLDLNASGHFHQHVMAHQIDALAVGGPEHRKPDAIDIRLEGDRCLTGRDRNLPPEHLVATVAGPYRSTIGSRCVVLGFHPDGERAVMMRLEIAGDRILCTREHEVAGPVRAMVERESQMCES